MSSSSGQPSASNAGKSADYVFFERTTAGFSDEAVPRAKTAQLKLEHYYKIAVDAAIERNTRCATIFYASPNDRRSYYLLSADVWNWNGAYKTTH